MLLLISKYIIYFIFYSFVGWLIEVIRIFLREKKFVNRGFFIGPILPIYGFGVLFITMLITGGFNDILSVFLKCVFVCSILEYVTSYVMEKIFKARWWDYSNKKFNINGRICLETMIPFGVLGSLVVIVVHPFVIRSIDYLSDRTTLIIGCILGIIFLIDVYLSFSVLIRIKNKIEKSKLDNTEEVRDKVNECLINNNVFFKHIANAYPKFKIKRGK